MSNTKLEELSRRAASRLKSMPAYKTAEDSKLENENFDLLEHQLYKDIVQEESKCK